MKKIVLFAFTLIMFLSFNKAHAQKANIGINVSPVLPLGDLSNVTDFGIGGDVSFDYYFNDHWDLGIEAGYLNFNYPDLDASHISFIPIQLTGGAHMDLDDWIDLYGELGAGAFITNTKTVYTNLMGATQTTTSSNAYFGLSPRVGLAFELNSIWFLDVNVNYDIAFADPNSLSYLGLNVGILYTIQEW